MRVLWTLVLTLPLLPLAACTSSEDMTLLHREIADVQLQVEQLSQSMPAKQDLDAIKRQLQEGAAQTSRSNADLAMRVEQLQEQIEALDASLERTTTRLEAISQELARARSAAATGQYLPPVTAAGPAPGGEGGAAVPPDGAAAGSAAASSPEELYRAAYEDYMRGNYDLAADGFGEYRRRWPSTELSDNALYWIGECLDAQDKSEEALAIFDQVLEEYPASDKAPAAQLKKGLLYLKLGDKGQGVLNLQYVVYEHPGSREADLARERLRSLGMTIR
ncbi:MAG TPA: tetratricopeptide repeat protein [Thermoanaerobaculales bacterium]|nr:tetratricopeptide repeat protein [Thermoanaerobaculales bacterium]HPA81349.1 tetratricopeptide repeat protein [Thermoanaerobaculales bacterium]HQL29374.1 tetratricopeptide repeat protein [Thermoanaerobaculales bacterium]HQN96056.1 tetratricopeptide repeat protein [Thermoanaerobaculales bacterium]HQP44703.1 tetratricopeptide repeat protein [Thermoanaerobaculales bacterium]